MAVDVDCDDDCDDVSIAGDLARERVSHRGLVRRGLRHMPGFFDVVSL